MPEDPRGQPEAALTRGEVSPIRSRGMRDLNAGFLSAVTRMKSVRSGPRDSRRRCPTGRSAAAASAVPGSASCRHSADKGNGRQDDDHDDPDNRDERPSNPVCPFDLVSEISSLFVAHLLRVSYRFLAGNGVQTRPTSSTRLISRPWETGAPIRLAAGMSGDIDRRAFRGTGSNESTSPRRC